MTRAPLARVAVVASFALVVGGCAGGGASSDPRTVVVAKGPPAGPASPAPRPCDDTRTPPIGPEQAEGTKIVEVCLVAGSPDTAAAVRRATPRLRPGATLGAGLLQAELTAAFETGLLHQIEAVGRPHGGGTTLFLTLEENPRIASLAFEGVRAMNEATASSSFPKAGAVLRIPALHAAERKLAEAYNDGGWEDATVTHVIAPPENGRARVTIKVVEGGRSRIGKVTFEGAKGGRDVPLRKAVELDEGAPVSQDRLERATLLVSAFYYDNGFLNVRVDMAKRTRAADGVTAIVFPIVEGPVFRIGTLKLRGVDAATEKEILAKAKSKPGEIFSRSKVKADLDAIRKAFADRGKQVTADPETVLDAKKGTVNVVVAITGG